MIINATDAKHYVSVPLGYSLNEDGDYEALDEYGHKIPCCEYGYAEEGIEEEE
jgi:hypothetical protein